VKDYGGPGEIEPVKNLSHLPGMMEVITVNGREEEKWINE
jgi:hypothetical protein